MDKIESFFKDTDRQIERAREKRSKHYYFISLPLPCKPAEFKSRYEKYGAIDIHKCKRCKNVYDIIITFVYS